MASQAQGFVHLLATPVDGCHEPQVFRMRWDQPLRRFARAYTVFRELGADSDVTLLMSTKKHGELDPTATASVYGFADGDQILMEIQEKEPPVAEETCPVQPGEASNALVPCDAPPRGSDVTPPPRRKAGQAGANDVLRMHSLGTDPLADPGSSEKASRAKPSSETAVVNAQRFRCPIPTCTSRDAREIGFVLEKGLKCHMTRCHPTNSIAKTAKTLELSQKSRRRLGKGGKNDVGLDQVSRRRLGDANIHDSGKAGQAKNGGLRGALVCKNQSLTRSKAGNARASAAEGGSVEDDLAPCTKPGLTRSVTVSAGPAKGWRVTAWLQDIPWRKIEAPSAYARQVRWHIVSPDRSRIYKQFNLLEAEESEGVYTQIYTAVRPGLLKKITQRRQEVQGQSGSIKRLATSENISEEMPPPPRPRKQPRHGEIVPRRSSANLVAPSSELATQPFPPLAAPVSEERESNAWACGCDAHFRRHPRCIAVGNVQPALIHLRDYMLIGRGESCDVVLDSKRTPQMISRCHVVLNREDGLFTLTDQGSLNGVMVNDKRMQGKQALTDGDLVTFGVPTTPREFDYVFEVRPTGAM